MRNSVVFFVDGPWENQTREQPVQVPSEVIPVFADADADVVCADEQVIERLGVYRKVKSGVVLPLYQYQWEPEN